MPILEAENLNYIVRDALDKITFDSKLGLDAGIVAMSTRSREFASELEMRLAGVAMVPGARRMLNDAMTSYWEDSTLPAGLSEYCQNREVVIGAGFHAAVYCATRVQMGFPKPIVLDRADAAHIGGAFAVSEDASFYLNSGNRPGLMGLPGNLESSLNYLPGAPIQPAMVSTGEYQTNADMALVIRLTLAQYAIVFPNVKVSSTSNDFETDTISVLLDDGRSFLAGRVIDARGCGDPSDSGTGDKIITFPEFMRRMGESPFPLKGLNRVAVIGGGDSGKCAVESLLGISPAAHKSVAGLDFIKTIDWFGQDLPQFCDVWRDTQRGRYQAIGKYLPRDNSPSVRRLTVRNERVFPQRGLDSALVGPDSYDLAVLCTGSELPPIDLGTNIGFMNPYRGERPVLGNLTSLGRVYGRLYTAGPAARLPFEDAERERSVNIVDANKVAMFRLAPRTSAMAASLPDVPATEPPENPF
jgi:hypothetical protein